MNPLWKELGLMEAATLGQAAYERFRRMMALDAYSSEREELRAAGVQQSAIDSLYPSDFHSIVGGVMKLMDSASLAHLTGNQSDTLEFDQMKSLLIYFASVGSLKHLNHPVTGSKAWDDLVERFETQMPPQATEELTGGNALICAMILTNAWSYMAHLDDVPLGHKLKVEELFVGVTDRLLPKL